MNAHRFKTDENEKGCGVYRFYQSKKNNAQPVIKQDHEQQKFELISNNIFVFSVD